LFRAHADVRREGRLRRPMGAGSSGRGRGQPTSSGGRCRRAGLRCRDGLRCRGGRRRRVG